MDSDASSRFAAAVASKRHESRYDSYFGFEEINSGDEDPRAEFPCPFCSEDFDIVGLCFHIDEEHPVEAKNRVCPICAAKVGMDMVGHITMQHKNFLRMQCRRRFRRGSHGVHSSSTLSLLRKQLEFQSILAGSSYLDSSSTAAADALLSSLIYKLPLSEPTKDVHTEPLSEGNLISKSSDEKVDERPSVGIALSDKDQEERAHRSEFVQGLLLSTIFADAL